jgi:SpoVK/Ycf46/Vps4 family AAA+-type ATPase
VYIFLYGTPGTGKTQLARVLAQHLACPLYEIASEDDDGDPVEGAQRLRAFSTAQTRKAWMNRLLEENSAPTSWLGNSINSVDPAFIRRFDWVIELPIPPKAQRERIIRESCSNILTDKDIRQLAACEDRTPAVVTRAAQVIGSLTDQFPVERLSTALQQIMDKTLVAQGHPGLNQDNAVRLPAYYYPGLINCDTDLSQIVDGIKRNGSARLCLFGMPGTGKTAYARWLSEQLDKSPHVKRGADLLSMRVAALRKTLPVSSRKPKKTTPCC